MVQNLLQTGTPFAYHKDDSSYADDLLDLDIADNNTIEVNDLESDEDMDFEDEK
jgi:hypothetical protein